MPHPQTISGALRQARKSIPRTLADIATRMSATVQAASRIERDADRANLATLAKFVRAMGGRLIIEIKLFGKDQKTFRGET